VANHLANFCDDVSVLTQLGAVNSQEEFIRASVNPKIEQHYLFRTDSPTIVKRRFVESYFFTKMMEVYEMNPAALIAADDAALCEQLEELVPQFDLVLVFDFGHEMMTRRAIEILCEKAKFLAVNAQCNAGNLGYHTISAYPRADYVCVAENEMRVEARDRRTELETLVLPVAKRIGAKWVMTTRGKHGCLCYHRDYGFTAVPALAGKVVDRMGAGDAFLGITSLCVAEDAPPEIVGFIGNVVGAHAVATVGHRTSVQRAALFKHIEALLK